MVPSDEAMGSMDWMSRGPATVRILSFLRHRGQGHLGRNHFEGNAAPCGDIRLAWPRRCIGWPVMNRSAAGNGLDLLPEPSWQREGWRDRRA
jgi:hypothetical protein